MTVLNWETIDQYQRFYPFLKHLSVLCIIAFKKYLQENKILYPKQLGFQFGHLTNHAIIQFVDQIIEAFENNPYTLGVFFDLSKAFDTVDQTILLKKLELFGIRGNNHNGIKSFLSNRKQYIEIDPITKTSLKF